MYEIEIKRDGAVVATIKWNPAGGGHNTTIVGTWGQVNCHFDDLQSALREAQRRIAGL